MTISIDSSALIGYYDSKAGILISNSSSSGSSSSTSSTSTSSTTTQYPTPPWNSTQTTTQTNAAVNAALSGENIVNPSAVKLGATVAGSGTNYKNLFALYQGLTTLQSLASEASQSGQSAYQLTQLQNAFSTGLAQVQSFLSSSPFTGFTVADGTDNTQQQTTAGVASGNDIYATGTVYSGDPNAPDPQLQGNVSFAAQVTNSATGKVTNVSFNLADMGSTPRTLGNVVNYMNAQLTAAGVATQISVVDTPGTAQTIPLGNGQSVTLPAGPDQYSLQIVGNEFENVSFSAPSQTPAVYVAQAAGVTTTTSANGTVTATTTTPAGSSSSSSSASSAAVQQLVKLDPSASNPTTFTDAMGKEVSNIVGTATAPDGSVYVLGDIDGPTTAGEIDPSQQVSGTQEVALLKYDSAGNLISTNVVGTAGTTSGLALAVSADGSQVAVAGDVTGALAGSATPSDPTTATSFVSVFDSQGDPEWTAVQNAADGDQINSVAFGSDGSVYVGGTTQSSLTTNEITGQSAAYLTGYSSSGQQTFTTQLGSTGFNTINGVTVDGSSIITAGVENGQAVVHSFTIPSSGGTPTLAATQDLGAIDGGSIAGVAVNSDGSVIVAGSTYNGALNGGAVTNAYSSGEEAFVSQLSSNLTPTSLTYYKGASGGDTTASAMTLSGGQVYITGQISVPPDPSTGLSTAYDGYVAQIDPSSGAVGWSTVMSGLGNQDAPQSIAVDSTGSSVLDALGLPSGSVDITPNQNLIANTSLVAGDSFTVGVFGVSNTVTIDADDTLQSLADKINEVSMDQATATVVTGADGSQQLQIAPVNSAASVTLGDGPSGQDALPGLGLTSGLISTATPLIKSKTNTLDASYGLGLSSNLNLNSSSSITAAQSALTTAINKVELIYQQMTTAPSTGGANTSATTGTVPQYLTNEIANYQAALNRLAGSSSSSSSSGLASLL